MHGYYECWSFSSAGTNVTDDELDTMLESGQTDVFTQNVSPQGGVSTHTHTHMSSVSENHNTDTHEGVFQKYDKSAGGTLEDTKMNEDGL